MRWGLRARHFALPGFRGNDTLDSTDEPSRQPSGRLSIVVPMWNEELYIEQTVSVAREQCAKLLAAGEISDHELVIVDDASTDETGRIADAMAREDPRVRVVHHARNRKLGGSIRTGLEAAGGDMVLYTDADLPVDMEELGRVCRIMRVYDAALVCAYRFDRTGEGWRRAVYSSVYNLLIRLAFGVRVRDVNFAFKLIRRDVLEQVTLRSEGSFIDAELVVRAHRRGFQIVQIGVDYFPRSRGESTLSSPGVIAQMLGEMIRLRREMRSTRALRE
jgi:glycosyltransferase involved in cell wall biosynthesis